MNYIEEINLFERWLETNYLPISSQLLWYKLMSLCNRCGWSEWVTVDNQRLMAFMQMNSEKTFIRCRDCLVKSGLIEYKKGKKGSPNKYKINTVKNTVQMTAYPTVKTTVETTANVSIINKHKQKQNIKEKINKKEISEIIEYLNFKLNSHYKDSTPKTITLIKTRIDEGFTINDFKTVIDKKVQEWGNDEKMKVYLRPETLFGTKFESYLNQPLKKLTTNDIDLDLSEYIRI